MGGGGITVGDGDDVSEAYCCHCWGYKVHGYDVIIEISIVITSAVDNPGVGSQAFYIFGNPKPQTRYQVHSQQSKQHKFYKPDILYKTINHHHKKIKPEWISMLLF